MKKKSKTAVLAAAVLCFTMLFAPVGSAFSIGDINDDGSVTAADARLVLRAAVGLETLTEEQCLAADLTKDGSVTAADARLVLRIAVGLEKFGEPDLSKLTMDNGVTYTSCGETKVLPSVYELVNSIKENADGKAYTFTNFSMTSSKLNSTDHKGVLLWELVKGMEEAIPTSTEYTDLMSGIPVTKNNFPVLGKSFVCGLHDRDIKSVKAEKVNGLDFVKGLPDSYSYKTGEGENAKTKTYSLVPIKKSAFTGSIYKITVTLKEEGYTVGGKNNQPTKVDKIYMSDYRSMLDDLGKDFSIGGTQEVGGKILSSTANIKSNLSVIYYFDAAKLEPVAAVYCLSMNPVITIKFGLVDSVTFDVGNDIKDYYFFDDYIETK